MWFSGIFETVAYISRKEKQVDYIRQLLRDYKAFKVCLKRFYLLFTLGLIMLKCNIYITLIFFCLQINATFGSSKLWEDDVTVGSCWTPWNPFAGIWILEDYIGLVG